MSPDFVQHSLFVPFAQQNPLDAGTGLGLSLVESTVQALNGKLRLETDESFGTQVTVMLPLGRLSPSLADPDSHTGDFHGLPEDIRRFSLLTMQLFLPTRWQQTDDVRHKRSLEIFTASLASTLRTWLNADLKLGSAVEEMPGVIFLMHTDLSLLKLATKDAFQHLKKVIFCPDVHVEAEVKAVKLRAFATIVGAVTPSKICRGVSLCRQDPRATEPDDALASDRVAGYRDKDLDEDNELTSCQTSRLAALPQEPADINCTPSQRPNQTSKDLPSRTIAIQLKQTQEPRFLLVDDNAINLKVAAMYAKKCSKQPSVLAGGGREAINASITGFDIILLDLSMPDVSGFDVAYAIREMERLQVDRPRAYIAALTGLVSSKDRNAAFAAGVDEYVTKPATLNDLLGVVANWKIARGIP